LKNIFSFGVNGSVDGSQKSQALAIEIERHLRAGTLSQLDKIWEPSKGNKMLSLKNVLIVPTINIIIPKFFNACPGAIIFQHSNPRLDTKRR